MAKAFLVSALRSGEGKTLITLGLLRLFQKKGLRVQPFKIGPDYIDPMWHQVAGGVPSYNLDLFAMGKDRLKRLFYTKSSAKELVIVEGVMGLFDGKYSTYLIAKYLKIPIVLVIDTYGLAESIRPLIRGTVERLKRAELPFAIMLNRISSKRHLLRVEKALRGYPILGYLMRDEKIKIGSRHLGLLLPQDLAETNRIIDYVAEKLEENLNYEQLENLRLKEFEGGTKPRFLPDVPYKSIAIAFDRAFNFYYQHILDEFREKYKLIFFSPLEDEELPQEAEVLYIGGGYPELFGEVLAKNKKMLRAIKNWVESKMPLYAECGGFVYLCDALSWNHQNFKLVGTFPFTVAKGSLNLGYRAVKPATHLPLFECMTTFKGHEFHYTTLVNKDSNVPTCYQVRDLYGRSYREGYLINRALGTYIHLISFDLDEDESRNELSI